MNFDSKNLKEKCDNRITTEIPNMETRSAMKMFSIAILILPSESVVVGTLNTKRIV